MGGQAFQLEIDLTNLKTRKQQIVDSMATRPVTSFDDDRSQQLKSIEKQMADIKTQLHMDRRRLAKLNVGQAFQLEIDLTNLKTRKQQIVDSMATRPVTSFDDD